MRKDGQIYQLTMAEVSDLHWLIGYCQGLREGLGSEGPPVMSVENLGPIQKRLEKIVGET